jgi:hypothetical protein
MPKLTVKEAMKNLDEYRIRPYNGVRFTPEMEQLLLKARTPDADGRVVSFVKLQELWKELGWGNIAKSTLSVRAHELKKRVEK